MPPGWRWPQDFIHDLVRWGRALPWAPGPAEVSLAELALDYEAFVGRALPASPDHRLRGTRLPLGERAQVLRKAVGCGTPPGGGCTVERSPAWTLSLAPPPGGARVRGALSASVLRGAPRGHVTADALGGALPLLVGQAPAGAGAHATTAQ